MCCWEAIVNQIIQAIIREMHQTAKAEQRQWAREHMLEAEINESANLIIIDVPSDEVKLKFEQSEIAPGFHLAAEMAFPNYRPVFRVKQPLKLAEFTALEQLNQ